jgi:DNA-binding MarR family transcriptional regulator
MLAAEQALASRLRLAVVRLTRRLRAQHGTDAPVTLSQLSAMATLRDHGPMSPGELAAWERVQPPSMTRVIATLVQLGLVDRRPHPRDGRQSVVTLTEAGQAYIDAEVSARERWLDARIAKLPPAEREILARAVAIIDRMASS